MPEVRREIASRSFRRGIGKAASPVWLRGNQAVRKPFRGAEHQVTIPAHSPLKVGTLSGILLEIATYLEISKDVLARELFG